MSKQKISFSDLNLVLQIAVITAYITLVTWVIPYVIGYFIGGLEVLTI